MGLINKIINKIITYSAGRKSFCDNPYLGLVIDADDADVIPDELFRVGMSYQYGKYMLPQDNKKAMEYYRKAAERGHAVAQLFMAMGSMQFSDDHTPDALQWLIKAAEQGERQALYNLAISYHRGDFDGKPDIELSLELFRKSAEKLYGPACARMACIYANGNDGVTAEKSIAKFWALEAYNYGDQQDGAIFGQLLEDGDLLVDQQINWRKIYQEAGEAGEPFAWHVLGNAFYSEERDVDKAAVYWQKALDMGCNSAKYNLALYKQRIGEKAEAFKLFEESAKWGCEDSNHALAELYYLGDGVDKDIKKAYEYNEKALNMAYPPARYLLAIMCMQNLLSEILPDKVMRGMSYMEMAASDGYKPAIEFCEISIR